MEEFLKYFDSSGTLNLIFLVLTIISILLAIYFYIKSKKDKKPVYSIKTIQLIEDNLSSIENLKIYYGKDNVENLSITKFAFWNAGRETINENDFVKVDHLRIEANENIIIYDFKVEIQDERNNFQIEKNANTSLQVSFDYLDRNQGIVLTVYHNGKENSGLKILGSFKGAKELSLGVEREKIFNALLKNKIIIFFENLINSEKLSLRILGFLSFFPMIIYGLVVIFPATLIDSIYDRLFNKSPKEFYLKED